LIGRDIKAKDLFYSINHSSNFMLDKNGYKKTISLPSKKIPLQRREIG